MQVLVAEDEEDLVSALPVGLGRAGHAVDTALGLAEAEAKLAVEPYDLTVLDLTLPDEDGFELCGPAGPRARRGRRRLPGQAVRAGRAARTGVDAAAPRRRRRHRHA